MQRVNKYEQRTYYRAKGYVLPSSLANRKESEYITEMPQGEASFVPNYGKKCFPERSGSKIGDLLKRHDKFLNDYPIYEKNLKKSLNVLEGEKIYANLKAGDDSNKKNKAQLGLDLKQQLAVEGKQRQIEERPSIMSRRGSLQNVRNYNQSHELEYLPTLLEKERGKSTLALKHPEAQSRPGSPGLPPEKLPLIKLEPIMFNQSMENKEQKNDQKTVTDYRRDNYITNPEKTRSNQKLEQINPKAKPTQLSPRVHPNQLVRSPYDSSTNKHIRNQYRKITPTYLSYESSAEKYSSIGSYNISLQRR